MAACLLSDQLSFVSRKALMQESMMRTNTILPKHGPMVHPELGVTLVEMLVALSILVILMMIAAPSFQVQVAKSRLTDASDALFQTLQRARTEAIRLGKRVTVCKSSNGTACDTSQTGWETGWIAFIDTNHSGPSPAVDPGEIITFKVGQFSNVKIKGNGELARYVSYAADGRAKMLNGGMLMGTLRICNPSSALKDNERAREIVISSSGRLRIVTPPNVDSSCPPPPSSS